MNCSSSGIPRRVLLFANTDWYLYHFRLPLAKALRTSGFDVVFCSPDGRYVKHFAEHGFPWRQAYVSRSLDAPWREFRQFRTLAAIIAEERISLVHSCTLKCVLMTAAAVWRSGHVSCVHAFAGLGHMFSSTTPIATLLRPAVARILAWACKDQRTRVIVQNPDDANVLLSRSVVAHGNLHVIRSSGVNLSHFTPRPGMASEKLTILFVGRLLRAKGICEYVEAARQIHGTGTDMRFIVAGALDSDHPDAVHEAMMTQWQNERLIQWHGHVEDVAALLRKVDVFVLPSYYGEGVPRSLIEAAACGLPLVTTNLPGCREVVTTDGIDGLHVPPRDGLAIAQALMRLDANRPLMHRLGIAARARAADFAEHAVHSRTIEVYDELLP